MRFRVHFFCLCDIMQVWENNMKEIYDIFTRNFPTIVRRKSIVEDLINDNGNKIFERRNKRGKLIAVAIVNKNTIYLL